MICWKNKESFAKIIWNIWDIWKCWENFKKFWTTLEEIIWNFIICLFFSKTWKLYLDYLKHLRKFEKI